MISTGSSDAGNSHTNLIHNKSWTTEFSPGRFNFPSLVPALQTSKEQVFTHPNLKEYIWQVKRRKHCFSHNVHQKRKFRHLIMSDNNSNDCHCAPLVVLPCHLVPGLPSDRNWLSGRVYKIHIHLFIVIQIKTTCQINIKYANWCLPLDPSSPSLNTAVTDDKFVKLNWP